MLSVKQLYAWYGKRIENKPVISGVDFNVKEGETLGLVGKSGSGKSTIAWAMMGMLPYMDGSCSGEIVLQGEKIGAFSQQALESIRWKKIAIVPQAAMNAFNPVMKIGCSLKEVLKQHRPEMNSIERHRRCQELMELTQLPEEVLLYYPHQMSGGMKQRAALAKALSCSPRLLILDEATTGLDVLTEATLLKVVREIQKKEQMSMLFISHDMRLVNALCHRKLVLKDGRIVGAEDAYFKEMTKNAYWLPSRGLAYA